MAWLQYVCTLDNYNNRVYPLQKTGLLFLTKRLPRKRNQNWRTFDNFQKVIVCELPNDYFL